MRRLEELPAPRGVVPSGYQDEVLEVADGRVAEAGAQYRAKPRSQ